jgi:hypothetical protein
MIESLKASSTALSSGTSDSQEFADFGDARSARDESENQNSANDQDSSWDVSTIFFSFHKNLLFSIPFFFLLLSVLSNSRMKRVIRIQPFNSFVFCMEKARGDCVVVYALATRGASYFYFYFLNMRKKTRFIFFCLSSFYQ